MLTDVIDDVCDIFVEHTGFRLTDNIFHPGSPKSSILVIILDMRQGKGFRVYVENPLAIYIAGVF